MRVYSSHMNGGTHHSCERREHEFMVLRKYTIISQKIYIFIYEKLLSTSGIP